MSDPRTVLIKGLVVRICGEAHPKQLRFAVAALSMVLRNSEQVLPETICDRICKRFASSNQNSKAILIAEFVNKLLVLSPNWLSSALIFLNELGIEDRSLSISQQCFTTKNNSSNSRNLTKQPVISTPKDGFLVSAPKSFGMSSIKPERSLALPRSHTISNINCEISEQGLVKDSIFALQGVSSSYLHFRISEDKFFVQNEDKIPCSTRAVLLKVSELGALFIKIKKFVDKSLCIGQMRQAFMAAIRAELSEYYRLLAILEAQISTDEYQTNSLTWARLRLWTLEPLQRFTLLAAICDSVKTQEGGQLLASLLTFTHHGNHIWRSVSTPLFLSSLVPFVKMLLHWMFEGRLHGDTDGEFFVSLPGGVRLERYWQESALLRRTMIPRGLITEKQAEDILMAGKSVLFLRVLCKNNEPVTEDEDFKNAEKCNELLNSNFLLHINAVIRGTLYTNSRRMLRVLYDEYHFLLHLAALRRYLLLGQGDFIRHLMDVMEKQLSLSAKDLYRHNLTANLETAIRSTNAQYDDPKVLERLDVRVLETSPGDLGWDVFSLQYHVAGPICAVFTSESIRLYLQMFNFLWRAKRIEFILSGIWQHQTSCNRLLMGANGIPEAFEIIHTCSLLREKMINFAHQMQYYLAFEVMECAWDDLSDKMKLATDLDHVIAAHQAFLDTLLSRALLDKSSKVVLTKLRGIFDCIVRYEEVQSFFYAAALDELQRRRESDAVIEANTRAGTWGVTSDDPARMAREAKSMIFKKETIPKMRAEFRIINTTYQDLVIEFLKKLRAQNDVSLCSLSFRLDFNEYYRGLAPELRISNAFM